FGAASEVAFDVEELGVVDGQLVIASGVEFVVEIDAVEDIADEVLEEEPWGDADLAAESAGDGVREINEVAVIDVIHDASLGGRSLGEDVPHVGSEFEEPVVIESLEADLHGPWVVESWISAEVNGESL